MASYFGNTDLAENGIRVWEQRIRLLELCERTLRATGKEVKDANDLSFMAKWIAGLSSGLFESRRDGNQTFLSYITKRRGASAFRNDFTRLRQFDAEG